MLSISLLISLFSTSVFAQATAQIEKENGAEQGTGQEDPHDHEGHEDHAAVDQTTEKLSANTESAERDPEFERAYDNWKKKAIEIFTTREEYKIVSKSEAKTVRQRWQALAKEGDEAIDELYRVGTEVYERRGVKDTRIGYFLMQRAIDDVENGEMIRANHVFQLLVDSKLVADKTMLAPAGVAAFAANDFELAKDFFDAARSQDLLNDTNLAALYARTLPVTAQVWQQELVWREREGAKDDLPLATIVTTKGEIKIELFENDAPNTVANFIRLAENSFYDDNYFTESNSAVVMTGSSTIDGKGSSPSRIESEATEDFYRGLFRGSILMLKDSATELSDSRFAFCKRPLDPRNFGTTTCFGRVLSGMDVVDKLLSTQDVETIEEIDKVISVTITRKRDHEYKVKRVGND